MERRGAHGVETIAPPQEVKRASSKACRAKNLQVSAMGPIPAAGAPNRLASKWLQRSVHPDDCSDLLILEEQDAHARQAVHLTSSASTAVTCSASFALRGFWRTFSETYSHLSMSVRNRLPNRERNGTSL